MRTPSQPLPAVQARIASPITTPSLLTSGTSRVRMVLEAVSDEFYVDPIDILSGGYKGDVLQARMACYWVMKKITRLSNKQIAQAFGRTDHTTAANGIAKTEKRRAAEACFKAMTDAALEKSQVAAPRKLAA